MGANQSTPSEPTAAITTVKDARKEAIEKKAAWTIKPQQIGLKLLVQPADTDDIDVDIVAIHGVGARPEYTWVHRETQVNWLSHPTMLPAALPKARIMAYNYASHWFGENAVKQTLSGVAKKLLHSLNDERENCMDRPIIFIGHCFGGLVAQEVYNQAIMHPGDHPGIADSIVGIVFLSTPHHGIPESSGFSTQGEIYRAIIDAEVPVQYGLMNTIAQDNEILVNVVHDFTRTVKTMQAHGPTLFCFYEQKECDVGRVIGLNDQPREFLVTEMSGTLSGHDKEALPLDHFQMNKFEDCNDDNYNSVRREIVKMMKGQRRILPGRWEVTATSSSPMPLLLEARSIVAASTGPRPRMPSLPAPIAKEAHFAPRGKILQTIEEKFKSTVNVVLLGDSGNGKTHTAVEYAHKYFEEHPGCHVHWVNAASTSEFLLSYKRIGEALRLAKETMTDADVVEEVHKTLKQDVSGHWLMILDGLDDESLLEPIGPSDRGKSPCDFVPSSNYARVLITTRSGSLARRMANNKSQYIIDVARLNDDDASYVLLGERTTDAAKRKDSILISKALEGSAGTIVLAYLYRKIRENEDGASWKAYKSKLQDLSSAGVGSSLMCSWRLLFDMIQERHPEDTRLLLLIGTLDVQSIPSVFFERSELFEQIPRLVDYGMVEPSTNQIHFTVTPIIRQCIQMWLDQIGKKASIQKQALSVLYEKTVDVKSSVFEALLPSTFAVLKFQPTEAQGKLYQTTLLLRVAEYAMERERPDLALKHLERGLSLSKDLKDKGGLLKQTKAVIDKARAQMKSSKPKRPKTESSDRDVLLELKKKLGKDDPDALRAANEFASSRIANGESGDSEEIVTIYKDALDWSEKTYGKGSVDSARRLYNLALAYDDRHEYEKAAELYHSASEVSERHLGAGSPELLKILTNLALIYCKQGNLETAEQAFEVVLTGQRNTLGFDHPETLMTRQNVAMLLEEMGRVQDAGAELANVFDIQVRLLGSNDAATLQTACRLAANYKLQGKLSDAERLFRATRKMQEKSLGKTHRDTAMTDRMLKELLKETGTKGLKRRSTTATGPPAPPTEVAA
ncbi:hypothetical protein F4818DRAFT_435546 [Hypoxylon cercidicola]|nr:hypothetical protein F4818DRAFT_435546 [Hypoxylon cercidicola]